MHHTLLRHSATEIALYDLKMCRLKLLQVIPVLSRKVVSAYKVLSSLNWLLTEP